LQTAARDGLLRPEELVGGLAIREAMAGPRSSVAVVDRDTAAFAMATTLGPWLWRATIV